MYILDNKLFFPPVSLAGPDGLLAMGGDLSAERLLLAYRNGIFPWYEGKEILWWSPDPRFVLVPSELKVSKSMKALLRKETFSFTTDTAFEEVIRECKSIHRNNQQGTWITEDIKKAYTALYQLGYAHSAECWKDGRLVGGLYGVRLGKIFFGESMFSRASNASKYALIKYVSKLHAEGTLLVDCQVYTEHLESLGAKMISRDIFVRLLKIYC